MTEINTYKIFTDEIYKLFMSYQESGFSREEAFELVVAYSRQSSMENVYSNYRKSSRDELRRRMNSLKSNMKSDELIKEAVMPKEKKND